VKLKRYDDDKNVYSNSLRKKNFKNNILSSKKQISN